MTTRSVGRSDGRTTDVVVSYGCRWYAYTDWTRRGRRTPRELGTRARTDPSSPRAPAHHHRRRRSQLAKTAAAVATGIAGLAERVRWRINARGIRTPRTRSGRTRSDASNTDEDRSKDAAATAIDDNDSPLRGSYTIQGKHNYNY